MFVPTKMSLPFNARRKLGDLLVSLSNLPHTFHLAGSYFFKVARSDSDVDLYAAYSSQLLDDLKHLGFFELGSAHDGQYDEIVKPLDPNSNTHAVMAHTKLRVHIQVFYDLDLALKTRDILAGAFNAEHTRTRGPERAQMWRVAEAAARDLTALATPA